MKEFKMSPPPPAARYLSAPGNVASGSTPAPARCSAGLSPPSFGAGVGEVLGWDHRSCRWYGRGHCTPSLNGHSTTRQSLATVANTPCENGEGWVNITAHLLQPVGLIAKRMKVLSERDGTNSPQILPAVALKCND